MAVTQNQRIYTLAMDGHGAEDVAFILGISVAAVQAVIQNLDGTVSPNVDTQDSRVHMLSNAGHSPEAIAHFMGITEAQVKTSLADLTKARTGHVASPAVPAASTNLTNPFGRPAVVNVAGGTAVAVSIDGAATGLGAGTFVVPPGKTINLGAYTVAPTWNWTVI